MTVQRLLPCYEICGVKDVLMIVLRSLYEAMNSPFCDVENGDVLIWVVARKLLVDQFGEPVVEGLVCIGEDNDDCNEYRMIFRCANDHEKAFARIDVYFDYDYGLMVNCFVHDKIQKSDVEYLVHKRIKAIVEFVEDEKTKKVVEELRKGSGG